MRPYRSLEEFLEAEARWLQRKTMLVVGAEELRPDTMVRFGVDLESGESVIRAEGRVIEYIRPAGESPGGLKVRFKRYGSSTKSVLDRAKDFRAKSDSRQSQELGLELMDLELDLPAAELGSSPEVNSVPLNPLPEPPQRVSGVHQHPLRSVQTPDNRDELLAKLRQRAIDRPQEVSASVAGKAS